MNSAAPSSSRYELLDVMRGIAALWVFCFHVQDYFLSWGPFVHWLMCWGFLGINIFFIISGYSVTASMVAARRGGESARSFLYRRYRRVYAPLWCSMALAVALPWICGTFFGIPLPANFRQWSPLEWFRVVTMTQVFFSHGNFLFDAFMPLNGVIWTLAIEAQFYLAVALAMPWGRRGHWGLAILTLVCLPMLFIEKLFFTGLFLPYWPIFALGMGIYALDARGWTAAQLFRFPRLLGAALILLLPFAMMLLMRVEPITQGMPAISCLFALWFWLGLDFKGIFLRRLRSPNFAIRAAVRFFLLLGAMSYSIYLLHTLLHPAVSQFLYRFVMPRSPAFAILLIAICLALFFPFYYFCEKPFVKPRIKAQAPPGEDQ